MPMAWRHLAPLQCMMGPATPAEGFDAMPSLLASGGESQYGDGEPGMDEVSSVFADDSSDPGFAEEEEDDEYAHKEKEDDEEESEAEEEDLGGEARFGTMRRYRCKNFWSEVDCKVNVLHRGTACMYCTVSGSESSLRSFFEELLMLCSRHMAIIDWGLLGGAKPSGKVNGLLGRYCCNDELGHHNYAGGADGRSKYHRLMWYLDICKIKQLVAGSQKLFGLDGEPNYLVSPRLSN